MKEGISFATKSCWAYRLLCFTYGTMGVVIADSYNEDDLIKVKEQLEKVNVSKPLSYGIIRVNKDVVKEDK